MLLPLSAVFFKSFFSLWGNVIITSVPAHIFLVIGFKQLVFLKPFQYRIQGGF